MKGRLFIVLLCLTACVDSKEMTLVVQHQENHEIYKEVQHLKAGDTFSLTWVHSVEHTPWRETYQLTDDGELELIETAFQSFGAGVPYQKGEMTVENGEVIIRNLNERIDALRWIHSHHVGFELIVDGEPAFQTEDLPHFEKVEIRALPQTD